MIPHQVPARRPSRRSVCMRSVSIRAGPMRPASCRPGPMRPPSRVLAWLAMHAALLTAGCRDAPSQESVEQAWKRADQAVAQVAEAAQQARHAARLRDIDRLRGQAESAELLGQVATLRGVTAGLTLALLALTVWLATEIRRRRVLSRVLRSLVPMEGGASPVDPEGT